MSKVVTITHTVDASPEALLKADLVVRSYYDLPRSQIRALFQNACVYINERVCYNPGTDLKVGQVLRLTFEDGRKYKETKKLVPSDAYEVVYEDGHLLVVNKRAGVLTVPTRSGKDNLTLIDLISNDFPKGLNIHLVHRLDRDTSGLLVFAKSFGVATKLKNQFEARKPERIYDAFVAGEVGPKIGTYESYLTTDEDLNQYSVKDPNKGKLAVTHYEVHKYCSGATWVKVKLETGRRNQIRVHFAEKDHPVLGDARYKTELAKHPAWKEDYLALHARTLGFKHPSTGKFLSFDSDLPDRMKRFLVRLED
jgi:23S rRNA pseudouridine1911/1915/1917 synthase